MSSYWSDRLLDGGRTNYRASRVPSTSVLPSRHFPLTVSTSVSRLHLSRPDTSAFSYSSDSAYGRSGTNSGSRGVGSHVYGNNYADTSATDLRRSERSSLLPDRVPRSSMSGSITSGFLSDSKNASTLGYTTGSSDRWLNQSSSSSYGGVANGSPNLPRSRSGNYLSGTGTIGCTTATAGGGGGGADAPAARPASSSSHLLRTNSQRRVEHGSDVSPQLSSSPLSQRYYCEPPALNRYGGAGAAGQRYGRAGYDSAAVAAPAAGAGAKRPISAAADQQLSVGEERSSKCDAVVGGSSSSCWMGEEQRGPSDSLRPTSSPLLSAGARAAIGEQKYDFCHSDSLPMDRTHARPPLDADRNCGISHSGGGSGGGGGGSNVSHVSRPSDMDGTLSRLCSDARQNMPSSEAGPASAKLGIASCNGDVGLRNLGNTCFMNSVIQCLSSTRPLLQYVVQKGYVDDLAKARASATFACSVATASTSITTVTRSGKSPGALTEAFATLLHSLWKEGFTDAVYPDDFKTQVQIYAPQFAGYSQHDAQEFLQHLLQGLHDDMNRARRTSRASGDAAGACCTDVSDASPPVGSAQLPIGEPVSERQKQDSCWQTYRSAEDSKIVDLFAGQLRSTLTCRSCGFSSTTYEPFWDLSLTIPIADYRSRNTKVCLTDCLEAFAEEEQLTDDERPVCDGCKTRTVCTKKLGIVRLPEILVLHLKRFTGERYRTKLSVEVDFPERGLDLTVCCQDKNEPSRLYDLYAVINHTGTVYSGHYTAMCKHPASGVWRSFDDHRVAAISSCRLISPEAYVLFYESRKDVIFHSSL